MSGRIGTVVWSGHETADVLLDGRKRADFFFLSSLTHLPPEEAPDAE